MTHEAKGGMPPGKLLQVLGVAFGLAVLVGNTIGMGILRNTPRPFRVPLYPFVPALALLGSLAFIVTALISDTTNSLFALALVAISWPIYRLFRRGNAVP